MTEDERVLELDRRDEERNERRGNSNGNKMRKVRQELI